MHPFPAGASGAEDLDFLPRVEELGFDSVWTSEHILFYGPKLDATVTLGAFAARTNRVKLGTAILLPAICG